VETPPLRRRRERSGGPPDDIDEELWAMTDRLPNLLIAGVPKAGTSSLFRYLAQHPDICAASIKEIRYFKALRASDGRLAPVDEYSRYFSHCGGSRYAMEATPSYCYGGRRMIQAIVDMLDRPRVIISLRNPVDRLWSAYTFQRTKGNLGNRTTFDDYLLRCEQKTQGVDTGPYYGGIQIGLYGNYLSDWFDALGDDTRVIFTDDLFADPARVVAEICRWLGIDAAAAAGFDYVARNKTAHAKNVAFSRSARAVKRSVDGVLRRVPGAKDSLRRIYNAVNTGDLQEQMSAESRHRLEERFSASNAAVAELLRDRGYEQLPSWLEAGA
jgi:hypothetical protein